MPVDGFLINDTTYAGEAAAGFIVKAITTNETVNGGHVYVRDGIKKKFTIPRFDADFEDFVQDRAPTPVSKGLMTTDARTMLPADYMIYTEFNPREYEAHWFATQLNNTLIDRKLPVSVESVVVQEVLKRHNRYLQKALWTSDTSNPSTSIYKYYDGFLKRAATNVGAGTDPTNKVTSTTLTAGNIQAELLKCYKAAPAALRYDPDMKFFMSYASYDFYADSQIAQTNKGVDITQDGQRTFKGRKIIALNDFPDNTVLVARGKSGPDSNLWVGMNSTEDAELMLAKKQANSEIYFIKMLMKVDVNIGWCSESVLYAA